MEYEVPGCLLKRLNKPDDAERIPGGRSGLCGTVRRIDVFQNANKCASGLPVTALDGSIAALPSRCDCEAGQSWSARNEKSDPKGSHFYHNIDGKKEAKDGSAV